MIMVTVKDCRLRRPKPHSTKWFDSKDQRVNALAVKNLQTYVHHIQPSTKNGTRCIYNTAGGILCLWVCKHTVMCKYTLAWNSWSVVFLLVLTRERLYKYSPSVSDIGGENNGKRRREWWKMARMIGDKKEPIAAESENLVVWLQRLKGECASDKTPSVHSPHTT